MRRSYSLVSFLLVVALQTSNLCAQDDWILPPESLALENIPRIPKAFGRVTNVFKSAFNDSLIGWDPIKREPIILRKGYSSWQVNRIESPGSGPKRLAWVPPRTYEAYYHPAGKYLLFRIDAGNERYQFYRYDFATTGLTLLTDGKSTNLYPSFSNSGDWALYSSNRRNGKDLDIYMINPLDLKSDRMIAQLKGEDWAVFDWSRDDKKIILSELISSNETYLWVMDLATGVRTRVTPQSRGEKIFNGSYAQFSRNGNGIYHITDRGSEFQRLAYLDLETRKYKYLTTHINWDVEEFVLSPDRRSLAFTTNEDGISRLHFLDTSTNRVKPLGNVPIGVLSKPTWHNSGTLLGFTLSSATAPSSVYSIDVKERRIESWTVRNSDSHSSDGMREPETIRWKSFDGKQISGFLFHPPREFTGKRPVIIDIHGGPQDQARPEFRMQDRYIVSEFGIVTIYPNIRGSTGYGKSFQQLDDGALRANCVRDIGALLDWIETRSDLDSSRILITGSSFGGYMTLSVAAKYGDRIRAAIALAAPSNIVSLIQTADKWYQDRSREEFGDERDTKMRSVLEQMSPLKNVQGIRKPILIAHGKLDASVPVTEAEQMVDALRKQGTHVWYLLAKNEGHSFNNSSTKDFIFFSRVLFIRTHLIGV